MTKKTGMAVFEGDAIVVPSSHLKGLQVENFTVFKQEEFQFSPHLNLIIGENGTGKSLLLKLAYTMIAASAEAGKKYKNDKPTKEKLTFYLSEKLQNVIRPESLNHLITFNHDFCEIGAAFYNSDFNFDFSIRESADFFSAGIMPKRWLQQPPVFIPIRELFTLYPGFFSLYESRYLQFEETYKDLCLLLGLPLSKKLPPAFKKLLSELEDLMGGKVILDKNDRFYLQYPDGRKLEMPLVSEGIRKLAMIARLLANGSFENEVCLFWDEPETNLNPKLVKDVARVIYALSAKGIQTFIAAHSLFLMRELEILSKTPDYQDVYIRIISLGKQDGKILVEQADHFDDVQNVISLDEELEQSDRFIEADDQWWSEQVSVSQSNKEDHK